MSDQFWIVVGFALLCLTVILLVSGGIALGLAIGLRRRLRRLEERIAELTGTAHPPSLPRAAPAPVPQPTPPPAPEAPPIRAPKPPRARAPQRVSFQETWADLERRLGVRWLNWIGALVVLVALAFLLKFLYDRNLIGPAGRVGVGLGAGIGFLLLGELRLRRFHDVLAQSVSATGIGGLFLTTYLAFKFYGFSGQLPTFALMVWFAAFAVALAVLRHGRILAALGLVCAYACPFLLSTGQDQAEALFAFLGLLAIAGGAVRCARDWPETTPIGLAWTAVYYAGWHARFFGDDRVTVAVAGACGIAVLFPAVAFARASRLRRPAGLGDVASAVVAELVAILHVWESLAGEHRIALGFVLVGIALWNLGLFWALRARGVLTRVLEEALLLLAAGALTLVIPAVMRAEGALVAWSLAAVVLADAGSRSRRVLLGVAACVALVAAPASGLAEEVQHTGAFRFVLNGVFAAWLVAALSWYISGRRAAALFRSGTLPHAAGRGAQVFGSILLLALLSYEVGAWFRGAAQPPGADPDRLRDLQTAALLGLWALFPAAYLWQARRFPALWILAAAHYAVMGLGYLTLLASLHRTGAFLFLNPQFASAVLFPAGVFVVARGIARGAPRAKVPLELYGHVLGVILLSVELYGILGLREWSESREWIRTALVSVAWTVYAFGVLWLGVWRARPAWRWFALALLGLTLAKVFFVDASQVEQIWRVLSFAVLGTLLMGCSYVYARHERRKKAELESDEAHSSRG